MHIFNKIRGKIVPALLEGREGDCTPLLVLFLAAKTGFEGSEELRSKGSEALHVS